MKAVLRAVPWAVAMLLIALLARLGWMDHTTTATMFAVIPALMVATMDRSRGCHLLRRKRIAQ